MALSRRLAWIYSLCSPGPEEGSKENLTYLPLWVCVCVECWRGWLHVVCVSTSPYLQEASSPPRADDEIDVLEHFWSRPFLRKVTSVILSNVCGLAWCVGFKSRINDRQELCSSLFLAIPTTPTNPVMSAACFYRMRSRWALQSSVASCFELSQTAVVFSTLYGLVVKLLVTLKTWCPGDVQWDLSARCGKSSSLSMWEPFMLL